PPAVREEPIQLEVRDSQMADVDDEQPEEQAPVPASRDDTGHEADEDDEELPSKRTRSKTRRESTHSPKATRSSAVPPSAEKAKSPETTGRRLRLRNRQRSNSRRVGTDEDEYQEDEGGASSDDSMSSRGRGSPAKRHTRSASE